MFISKRKERLRNKNTDNILNKLNEILNDLGTCKTIMDPQIKKCKRNIKRQKHFTLSVDNENINYDRSRITDNYLEIVYGEKNPQKYLQDIYNEKYAHSFTFSEKSFNEHVKKIKDKLHEHINNINAKKNMNESVKSDGYYVDNTLEHKGDDGRLMYKYYYIVNIFPYNTFINERGYSTRIATSYVVAKNYKDVIHIFFEYCKVFEEINEKENLKHLIYEFNSREQGSDITSSVLTIINNLNRHYCKVINNNDVYELNKIDDENFQNYRTGEYKYEPNLIQNLKMIDETTNGNIITYSRNSDFITDQRNINLLTNKKTTDEKPKIIKV